MPRSYSPLRGKTGAPLLQLARLLRCEVLVIAQADDVLEHRRARRQVVRVQELCVEEVVSLRSAVYDVAALEHAGPVLRVVHADQRAGVVHGCAICASVLEEAQEVVHAAVGSEVLSYPGWLREWNALTRGYRNPIVARVARAIADVAWAEETDCILPSDVCRRSCCVRRRVREQSDRISNDGGGGVQCTCRVAPTWPERICVAAIVVAKNVNRFIGGNGEAIAKRGCGRSVGKIACSSVHAAVDQSKHVARSGDHIVLRGTGTGVDGRDVRLVRVAVDLVCASGHSVGRNREIRLGNVWSTEVKAGS